MKIKIIGLRKIISDEFYLKKFIIFMGILYWIYGCMPVVDRLFNIVTILSFLYLLNILANRKQFTWQKLFGIILFFSGFITISFNKFSTINLVAIIYASIEIILLTYCDFRKSKEVLKEELDSIVNMFLVLGFFVIVISLFTYFIGLQDIYYYPEITTTTLHLGKDRFTGALIGILSNANISSDFCVIYLGLVIYSLHNRKNKFAKIIAMSVDLVMLFFTYSRGGYIGAIVIVISFWGLYLLKKSARSKSARIGFIILLIIIFLSLIVILMGDSINFQMIIQRSSSEMNESTRQRFLLWKTARIAIASNPLILLYGSGTNITSTVSNYAQSGLSASLYNNMHNIYVQTILGYGILGIIPFLGTIFYLINISIKNIFKIDKEEKGLLAIIAILFGVLVINLVESDIYMKKAFEGTIFWVLLGYVSMLSHKEAEGRIR